VEDILVLEDISDLDFFDFDSVGINKYFENLFIKRLCQQFILNDRCFVKRNLKVQQKNSNNKFSKT
jgi:hypothetical protein